MTEEQEKQGERTTFVDEEPTRPEAYRTLEEVGVEWWRALHAGG